jgi:STE24 endopeptidase
VTSRTAALTVTLVLAVAFVLLTVLSTPWTPAPAPRQGRTAVSESRDFTEPQIAREKRFHGQLRPWTFGALGLGLVLTLALGLTPWGARVVELVSRGFGGHWAARAALGVLALGALGQLVAVPLAMGGERVLRRYGLSTQDWAGWWADLGKAWALSAVLGVLGALVFFAVARAAPRTWWLWLGAGAAAVVFALSFLYPVLIAPIFNNFTPMEHGPLRAELIAMAARDGVPVEDVQVADASRRTTALNAYVAGYGASRRIVVYDTLLRDAPPAEVKLVVAHELGHAKRNDVLHGTAVGALGAALGACALFWVLQWAPLLGRAGVAGAADPRALGLILAVVTVATLVTMPLQNLVSRRIEARADEHALELTHDPATFIEMQRRLGVQNLSELSPNPIIYAMFSSHPTGPERIAMARDYASRTGIELAGAR